jgi:hypothetical protein
LNTIGLEPTTSSVSTGSANCNSLKTRRTDGSQIAQKHPFLTFSTGIAPEISKKKKSKTSTFATGLVHFEARFLRFVCARLY